MSEARIPHTCIRLRYKRCGSENTATETTQKMLLLLPCSWITARLRHFRLLYCTAKRQKRRGEYSKTKETDPWMAAATEGVDKDLEMEEERCQSRANAIGAKTGNKRAYTLSRLSQWHLPPRAVQAVSRSACCAYS